MNIEAERYCVYAIESEATGRVYIGQAASLTNRLAEHNNGRVKSTKLERPWRLIALEKFNERSSARWREYSLKKSRGSRSEWLQASKI